MLPQVHLIRAVGFQPTTHCNRLKRRRAETKEAILSLVFYFFVFIRTLRKHPASYLLRPGARYVDELTMRFIAFCLTR